MSVFGHFLPICESFLPRKFPSTHELLTSLELFHIVSREPSDFAIAHSLPPPTIDHLHHCDEVTFLKLKLCVRVCVCVCVCVRINTIFRFPNPFNVLSSRMKAGNGGWEWDYKHAGIIYASIFNSPAYIPHRHWCRWKRRELARHVFLSPPPSPPLLRSHCHPRRSHSEPHLLYDWRLSGQDHNLLKKVEEKMMALCLYNSNALMKHIWLHHSMDWPFYMHVHNFF